MGVEGLSTRFIACVLGVCLGFGVSSLSHRGVKVHAIGPTRLYNDKVEFHPAMYSNKATIKGNEVVGFSCTETQEFNQDHCFVASR